MSLGSPHSEAMTNETDIEEEARSRGAQRRRSWIRLVIGVVAYASAMIAVRVWGHLGGTAPARFLWAFLPLIPAAWLVINITLRARQLDEYQIKLVYRALVVGFTVAIFTAATLGMLGISGLYLPYAGWIVVFAGGVSWGVTNIVTGAVRQF
jgi:hypothetical protein